MERIIDVYTKEGRRYVWTYAIRLGGRDYHPSIVDFEREALRLAQEDHKHTQNELTAKVRQR